MIAMTYDRNSRLNYGNKSRTTFITLTSMTTGPTLTGTTGNKKFVYA